MEDGAPDPRWSLPVRPARRFKGYGPAAEDGAGPDNSSDTGAAMTMEPLATVNVERRGEISVARLRGEIDTSNVTDIGDALGDVALEHRVPGMVVDLSEVAYLNSATVKLLFDLAEQMRQRRQQLRLVMTETAPMRKLILLLKFDLVVPLDKTIEDALEQIRMRSAPDRT